MERQFSSYEALFVFDLDLGDEGIKAIIEKFKKMRFCENIVTLTPQGK